jgi:hypothetical protein
MAKTLRRTAEVNENEFRAARREAARFSKARREPEIDGSEFDTLSLAYASTFASLAERR